MKVRVLTTFGRRQWEEYGSYTLPLMLERFPREVEFQFWCDSPADVLPSYPLAPNLTYHHLTSDPDHERFMEWWERLTRARGQPSSYLWDAGKFAHKVFALTNEAARADCDWLVFLGADVETLYPVEPSWFPDLLRGDFMHLGRTDIRSSETDFLAVRIGNTYQGDAFLEALRKVYTSGDLFHYAEWIDGYVVARLAVLFEAIGANVVNLSAGLPGLNVFEKTVLGERLRHWKGPGGKAALREKIDGIHSGRNPGQEA